MRIIFLFIIVMLVNGCAGSTAWYSMKYGESVNRAKQNNENMLKLKIGMSKEETIKIMGNPDKTEAYKIDSRAREFLFYRTQATDYYLNDKDINLTPVAFEDGLISGWGRNFYDQAIKFKSEIKQDITVK